ncbi:ATP-binding protein [Micromonospora schwarzwaldensis]|uniref:ATP-binding protein n=1 Tax=Micromonospora sp. DSM 45708 TaxID=3111767 RepID=UPI0031D432C0
MFERSYRADTVRSRDHGGSGIGLAVAPCHVVRHGGRITATRDGPGAGAAFTVHPPPGPVASSAGRGSGRQVSRPARGVVLPAGATRAAPAAYPCGVAVATECIGEGERGCGHTP